MTEQQRQILSDARHYGGTITKKQVVESYGHCYFCNGAFHLGNILSRMVNAGLLIRVKPGVFEIGKGTKPVKPVEVDENQTTLF